MITPEHADNSESVEATNKILLGFKLLLIEVLKDNPSPNQIEHHIKSIISVDQDTVFKLIHNLTMMITENKIFYRGGINIDALWFLKNNRKATMILIQILYSALDLTHEYNPSFPTNYFSGYIPTRELFFELKIINELQNPLLYILGGKALIKELESLSNTLLNISTSASFDRLKDENNKEIYNFNSDVLSTLSTIENRLSKIREFIFEGVRNHFMIAPKLFSHDMEGLSLRKAFNQAIFTNFSYTAETALAFLKINMTSLEELSDKMLNFLNNVNSRRIFSTHFKSDLEFIENLSNMILEIIHIFNKTDIVISRENSTEIFQDKNPNILSSLLVSFDTQHPLNKPTESENPNTTVSFNLSIKQMENAELIKRIENKMILVRTRLSEERGKLN